MVLGIAAISLFAEEEGDSSPEVIVGEVKFETKDGQLLIHQKSKVAIYHFQSFDLGDNTVRFISPFEDSISLIRVVGDKASLVHRQIESSGSVILVNPNGLMIGPAGLIDLPANRAL